MASEAVGSKQPQDIELAVIGNGFCLLIASAGLLAGSMAANLSLEYWREDIAVLVITAVMGIRLLRNLMDVMTLYQETPLVHHHRRAEAQERVNVQPEGVVKGQIAAVSSFSPDKVVEEVVKRIETQKAEAVKKNKFSN
jgi:NAD(P)-dependent dehydrogenase (short-subunit alcohol dehydrogenase family)